MLQGRNIVLGITGGIAAYKAADLASKLTQAGAVVDVVMTKSAQELITPITFRAITHRSVVTGMFDTPIKSGEYSIEHISLALKADIIVIAPATANTIAKIAAGIADDILTCTILAAKAPILVAPAMNVNMYENQVTQENVAKLKARGFFVIGPASGMLACGDVGMGRMVETEVIVEAIKKILGSKGDFAGKRIVITAGGTQEPIDPVRILTNRSSGKMGYALAEAARDRGADAVLISAPTALPTPYGIEFIGVQTAMEMRSAVQQKCKGADILIMAAAVADYRPVEFIDKKIKKESEYLTIELTKNPDIISEVSGGIIKVGFAAESENLIQNARSKLISKHLDLIVANDIKSTDSGFSSDMNRVVMLDTRGNQVELPLLPKVGVAHRILDAIKGLMQSSCKKGNAPADS